MNKKQQEWAESHIGLVFTIKGQRREVISYQGGEADLILQFKDGHTYTKRWPKWSYEENPPKKPVQFNSEQIAHIYDTMQQFIRQPPSAFEDPTSPPTTFYSSYACSSSRDPNPRRGEHLF